MTTADHTAPSKGDAEQVAADGGDLVRDGLQGAHHSHSSGYGEDVQGRRPPEAGMRTPRGTCSALPKPSPWRTGWRGWAMAVLEYLLGFLSLSIFATYALSQGSEPSDQFWIDAFRLAGPLALLECLVMVLVPTPANRLVLGANLWLMIGGAAAWLEWWELLRAYQRIGEASLFLAMLLAGVVSLWASDAGFVGARGARDAVRRASLLLLLAVLLATLWAWWMRGHFGMSSVIPVICLGWINRALKVYVRRRPPPPDGSDRMGEVPHD